MIMYSTAVHAAGSREPEQSGQRRSRILRDRSTAKRVGSRIGSGARPGPAVAPYELVEAAAVVDLRVHVPRKVLGSGDGDPGCPQDRLVWRRGGGGTETGDEAEVDDAVSRYRLMTRRTGGTALLSGRAAGPTADSSRSIASSSWPMAIGAAESCSRLRK